jgi:hypothetical protein
MTKQETPEQDPSQSGPGTVTPERTPGTAPSVVPLPSGADPSAAPGEHPLPEDAIEGYPQVAKMYEGTGGNGEGAEPAPDPTPVATPAGEVSGPDAVGADSKSGDSKSSTSGKSGK